MLDMREDWKNKRLLGLKHSLNVFSERDSTSYNYKLDVFVCDRISIIKGQSYYASFSKYYVDSKMQLVLCSEVW